MEEVREKWRRNEEGEKWATGGKGRGVRKKVKKESEEFEKVEVLQDGIGKKR